MLLYWFEHTLEAVDELLVAVGAEVEPRVALEGYLARYAAHGQKLLAAELLQLVLLVLKGASAEAQLLAVLVADTVDYAVELLKGEGRDEALRAGNVL